MNIDKFILLFLSVTFYANDVAIETLHGDLTPMYSLIGVVGVLAPVIKHYYLKATQENTKGGVVYDNMMNDNTINSFQETTKSEIEEDCNNVESLG